MKMIKIFPIGIVRVTESNDAVRNAREGVSGVIEIFEEYSLGLTGIEGFSHLILITYLDRISEQERGTLMVKPKRYIRLGIAPEVVPTVGVFCTDSPHRPNPIAISIVRLLRTEGRRLHVTGLDLFDGTPVLDIKPYTESRVVRDLTFPKWYSDILNTIKDRVGASIEP